MDPQLQSIIRHVFTTLGGLLVAKGKLDSSTLEAIIGLVMFVLPLWQGQKHHKKIKKKLNGTTKGLSNEEFVGQ